jgi:hypothetical protein
MSIRTSPPPPVEPKMASDTLISEEGFRRPPRFAILLLIAIGVGQALSYLPELSGDFRFNRLTGRDDLEMYLALGHSLAHGRGYTRSFDREHYIAHIHWPPGFPLLLAGTFCCTDSLWAAHALVMFFALANTLLLWLIARRYLGELLALFAVVMLVCSPLYDQLATHIMAEQPTTFFLLLALWSLGHWIRGGYRLDRWAVVAACAMGYGLLVKGLVLPVAAGFGLYALLCSGAVSPGRWVRLSRTCLLLLIALTPWIAWTVRSTVVKAPGYDGLSEMQTFLRGENPNGPILPPSAFVNFAWTNLKWYFPNRTLDAFAGTGWFLTEYAHLELPAWLDIILLGLLALSLAIEMRSFRRDGFITVALAMALLLLVPRPWGGAPRYWLNLQPLVLLIILGAIRKVWLSLDFRFDLRRWRWLPGAMGVLGAGLAFGMLLTDHLHREPQGDKGWNAYVTLCQQARDLMPPEAVVVSHNETAARWITHRFAIPTEQDLDGSHERPLYVICPLPEASTERKVSINRFGGRLLEVARNDYYVLYRLRPEAEGDTVSPPNP